MRLFVAVRPRPQEAVTLAAAVAAIRRGFGEADALSWTDPARQHLTLHFLGHVDSDRLPALTEALIAATGDVPAFDLELRGVGAFPPTGSVRTVWLGVERGRAALESLHARIGRRLRAAGVGLEARGYAPHLTLARVRRGGRVPGLRRRLATVEPPAPIVWHVVEVVLFESDLSGPRPRYTVRATGALAG